MNTRQQYKAAYRAARIAGLDRNAANVKRTTVNTGAIKHKARLSLANRQVCLYRWERHWLDGKITRVLFDIL